MGWEFIALFFGAAALGIFILFAIFIIGLLKWLLQGYFLFRVAEIKSYHLPWLSFIPFGTFYIGGQGYDGNILKKGSFDPKHIGLAFAITGLVLYLMGLSIGDLVITYLLMESIAFIGIFTAYVKQPVIAVLLALLNVVTAGIAAIVILFLYSRKLKEEFNGKYGEDDLADAAGYGSTDADGHTDSRPSHPNDPNLNRDI
ncbi:hypothetical protein [Jeotgalicoccus sp. WY2]|uniref:hypothetical protein n=1 Tax=Jeotgalicoccus sp. WY2 TaxID=2708346 RepID=UPI001BD60679|nr:hypothetical protein [Jeotgalicoccus sp. WY2]